MLLKNVAAYGLIASNRILKKDCLTLSMAVQIQKKWRKYK